MKILRRSFVLVLLAVILTVSGAFATWVFSGGGIDGVTGWLTPSFGDFVFPNAVYITRAAVADENGATGRVVSYAGTLLRIASTLGSAVSSSVSYRVEVLNNAGGDMAFGGVTVPEGGYPNVAIAYRVDGMADGTIVKPGERAALTLTFSYADGVPSVRELVATMELAFGEPIFFEEEDIGAFTPGENYKAIIANVKSNMNGYGLNDSHKGDVVHRNLKTRGLLYNGDKGVSGGQLDKFHDALQVDDTKNIDFVLQYVSDEEYVMYLFSKDDERVGNDVMVYRQIFYYDAEADLWEAGSALRGHAVIKTFTFYSRSITSIKPEDWQAGDIPTE